MSLPLAPQQSCELFSAKSDLNLRHPLILKSAAFCEHANCCGVLIYTGLLEHTIMR